MLESIEKHRRSNESGYIFSLLIPSWNNSAYLKNCIRSINKNSCLKNQIIVIVNEGKDDTVQWIEEQPEIDYIYSKDNLGICYGLNAARSLIKADHIVYINDDMYLLPNWDKELYDEIQLLGTKEFMLSGTMIEPHQSFNPCVIVKDYGDNLEDFKEELLLREYPELTSGDWSGSMWPPFTVHIDLWDIVGGMSIEYSPGMHSDPDFARKLYEVGVKLFKGKGSSLVYHFGSKTTKRLGKNKGRKIFLLKWGITVSTFKKVYLSLGNAMTDKRYVPGLDFKTKTINKIKRILSSW